MYCINCNCEMLGNGYSSPEVCENLTDEDAEKLGIDYMAPDEGPIYCSELN